MLFIKDADYFCWFSVKWEQKCVAWRWKDASWWLCITMKSLCKRICNDTTNAVPMVIHLVNKISPASIWWWRWQWNLCVWSKSSSEEMKKILHESIHTSVLLSSLFCLLLWTEYISSTSIYKCHEIKCLIILFLLETLNLLLRCEQIYQIEWNLWHRTIPYPLIFWCSVTLISITDVFLWQILHFLRLLW